MSPVSRLRPLLRGAAATAVVLAAGSVLAAPAHAADGRTFLAFGDSYTSGLGLPDQRATPPGEPACFRSSRNYASQVAAKLGLGAERSGSWADLSCSNATLSGPALQSPVDLRGEVALAEKAGLIGKDTRFVAFTAGGNDRWDAAGLGLFAGAVLCLDNDACGATPPASAFGSPASVTAAAYVARAKPAVDRIRALAPKARIAVVEYAELFPSTGPLCRTDLPTTTPAAAGSAAYARSILGAFGTAQRGAARTLGLTYVDASVTAGHDICKEAGTRWFARTGDSGAAAAHPTTAAHTALAKVVYAARPSIPRARVSAPSSARIGARARFHATSLTRASGYRARLTRRMTVGGRVRTCTAPVGSKRTADGTATFTGTVPSRLTCAGASGSARRPTTAAGRYTVRVCVESSSGACRSTGSTVTDALRLRR